MWKDAFQEGKERVLATELEAVPNANIVISLGLVEGKLLIADCQMQTTIRNLKKNPKVCVISDYLRLSGNAQVFDSGEYFDLCVKKTPDYTVRHAILIHIEHIFDLDKVQSV